MLENRWVVENDLQLKKEVRIVTTGVDWRVAGVLVLYFKEKCLTNICTVVGRNSDNPFIKNVLGWESRASLDRGLACPYHWISQQDQERGLGERVGIG